MIHIFRQVKCESRAVESILILSIYDTRDWKVNLQETIL